MAVGDVVLVSKKPRKFGQVLWLGVGGLDTEDSMYEAKAKVLAAYREEKVKAQNAGITLGPPNIFLNRGTPFHQAGASWVAEEIS